MRPAGHQTALEQGVKGGKWFRLNDTIERWPNAFFAKQGLYSLVTAHAMVGHPHGGKAEHYWLRPLFATRIIELAAKADAKNLKVGVGLMCRHSEARRELFWQAKRFHSFLWASGGVFSDFYVHHVDEVCWMKNAWPVKAEATGGRHFCGKLDDQNFDSYGVEWTFADGTKFFYSGRTMKDCEQKFGVGEQWVFHRRECPDHALSSPSACLMSASGTSPAILCAATLCARTALRDPRRKRPHQSRPLRDA